MSSAPDIGALEIPIDQWSEPFWTAASRDELLLPACAECRRFRWPPGPFCPHCQSQKTQWREPGPGRVYSFTLVRIAGDNGRERVQAPALVEFPEADGVRVLAAIVETEVSKIRIGAALRLSWSQAANAKAPVFRIE